MKKEQRIIKRYSEPFKLKVISEIECGKLSISEARKIYDISGTATVQDWLRKYGKQLLLNKIVRIEMADEKAKLKELEKKIKQLESALANTHLKNMYLESLIEIAKEQGIDLKKNGESKGLKEQ